MGEPLKTTDLEAYTTVEIQCGVCGDYRAENRTDKKTMLKMMVGAGWSKVGGVVLCPSCSQKLRQGDL